jgi:hypothetical protein
MGFSTGPFSGFGFLRSVSPGAAARAAAELLPVMRASVALPRRAQRPAGER